jgi:hypothetical protein
MKNLKLKFVPSDMCTKKAYTKKTKTEYKFLHFGGL